MLAVSKNVWNKSCRPEWGPCNVMHRSLVLWGGVSETLKFVVSFILQRHSHWSNRWS